MTEPDFIPLEFKRKNPQEMMDASMAFYHEIKHRRTVRQFSQRPVPIEVIKNAIRSAGTAPSGANRQPWHFVVVTDPGVEGRDQHEAAREVIFDPRSIGLDSDHTVVRKAPTGVGEQADRLQGVVGHHRFEDVEFEVAAGATDGDRDIVADDLGCDHRERLALSWIHLAGHDR